jgi:hypothetical protein
LYLLLLVDKFSAQKYGKKYNYELRMRNYESGGEMGKDESGRMKDEG